MWTCRRLNAQALLLPALVATTRLSAYPFELRPVDSSELRVITLVRPDHVRMHNVSVSAQQRQMEAWFSKNSWGGARTVFKVTDLSSLPQFVDGKAVTCIYTRDTNALPTTAEGLRLMRECLSQRATLLVVSENRENDEAIKGLTSRLFPTNALQTILPTDMFHWRMGDPGEASRLPHMGISTGGRWCLIWYRRSGAEPGRLVPDDVSPQELDYRLIHRILAQGIVLWWKTGDLVPRQAPRDGAARKRDDLASELDNLKMTEPHALGAETNQESRRPQCP